MKKSFISSSVFLSIALLLSACQQSGNTNNPAAQLGYEPVNGLKNAQIEVAITQEQKEYGLMNRLSMPMNNGMLFVFDQTDRLCFWMKDTLIPLSIGFIDENGVLLQTTDMQARSLDAHCTNQPARYAIEMNLGWFGRNQVQVGTKILNIHPKH